MGPGMHFPPHFSTYIQIIFALPLSPLNILMRLLLAPTVTNEHEFCSAHKDTTTRCSGNEIKLRQAFTLVLYNILMP